MYWTSKCVNAFITHVHYTTSNLTYPILFIIHPSKGSCNNWMTTNGGPMGQLLLNDNLWRPFKSRIWHINVNATRNQIYIGEVACIYGYGLKNMRVVISKCTRATWTQYIWGQEYTQRYITKQAREWEWESITSKEGMEDNEIYIILFFEIFMGYCHGESTSIGLLDRTEGKLSKGKKYIWVLVKSITNATTQPLKWSSVDSLQ